MAITHHTIVILLALTLLIMGCTSTAPKTTETSYRSNSQTYIDDSRRYRVVETALAMLGQPYRYGGSSPGRGFDCSGLVLYSHRQAGIQTPRTATQQLRYSKSVNWEQLQPGDLLFFQIEEKPSHVTIYLGDGQFIHAPSSGKEVSTESLDNPYWEKRLHSVGSYF